MHSFSKKCLVPLATMAEASETDEAIQRKARGRGTTATSGADVIRPGKGITLVISNEYIDNIIRIIKSPEQLERLIDGVSETVKNEFFSIMTRLYIDSLVTNILKIKVNKGRKHRKQNLRKTNTTYCKLCT